MKYLFLAGLVLAQSSCISRWTVPESVDNDPRRPDVVSKGDFDDIDKDKDGVISKTEFVDEKEKTLDETNSGYLWVFIGIVVAVAMACCVPFVYMFTAKHVKLKWAKAASKKEEEIK